MHKILIGVCDIGNGHMNRQKSVISALLKYTPDIVIAVTEKSRPFFSEHFPTLKTVITRIPWVVCGQDGVDYAASLSAYEASPYDFYKNFLQFSIEVEKIFGGKPDFVLTDYEPTVAQYAYSAGLPLICLEQQSKFLYLPETPISGYSRNEEAARLNFFFPRVDMRIVSSFFELPDAPDDAVFLPPIIGKLLPKPTIRNRGVVYFSPYSSDTHTYEKVLNSIQALEDFSFTVYTKEKFPDYESSRNIVFRPICSDFIHDLAEAEFVISSSGHQLISEALALEVPLLLFPLNTYEQHYNCLMVKQNGLGSQYLEFTSKEFLDFYARVSEFRANIRHYKDAVWSAPWDELLLSALNDRFGDFV